MRLRIVTRILAVSSLMALLATVLVLQPKRDAVAAPPETLPADLALVPADAIAFIHVRGADLWKSEFLARFRTTFEKAGPKALAALDSQFVPKPSTFDRLTVFGIMTEPQPNARVQHSEPVPIGILRFSAPFEVAEIVASYLPKATAVKVDGKAIYRSEDAPFELYFPDHQHIVIGPPGTLETYLKRTLPKTGPLSAGLALAAAGKPVVGSVNIRALPIPEKELQELPAEVKPLLKAEHVTASLDLTSEVRVNLVAGYASDADAADAEKAIDLLAKLGRKELAKLKEDIEKRLYDPKLKTPRSAQEFPETLMMVFALGGIAEADELLANPGALVKRQGRQLTASVALPKELVVAVTGLAAMGVGLLVPAVQKTRAAAARLQSMNNLKQIALAVHNYNDVYGHFPNNYTDKDGKPILSWRVAILPFIEQQNIFNKFKTDEPWDSPNNKQWSQVSIKTFMSPLSDPPVPPGMTTYKAFVGPHTVFEPGKKIRLIADIPDGTSNTIMCVESGDPVPWAKPDDIPFDPKKPLPKLGIQGVPDIILVAMCDGSVRTVNIKAVSEKTLSNAITRDDGMLLGSDW